MPAENHPSCHSLCLFRIIELLNGEGESVVVAVIDAEHQGGRGNDYV